MPILVSNGPNWQWEVQKTLNRAPPLNLSVFGRAGFLSQDKIFVYLIAGMQMSNFRTKLPNWTAVSLGDGNYDRGQGEGRGNKSSSSIELLTLDSEFTQERPNSSSSVWKPVWYTGWHTGILASSTSVIVVLFINVGLTIYAATNPEYKMEKGIGTLYSGSCHKSSMIGLWLHLGINALSTLLLSGSNYTQQCLAAPTQIGRAHV